MLECNLCVCVCVNEKERWREVKIILNKDRKGERERNEKMEEVSRIKIRKEMTKVEMKSE